MLSTAENLTFTISGVIFVILSVMILSQICTHGMYWSNAFISDQLSACEDHPSFEWIGFVFLLMIWIQTCILLRVWTRHYHCNSSYNLWFHMLAFHFLFSFACVYEFRNDKSNTSNLHFLGLDRVQEKSWHAFAAVQAIIEFSFLHALLIFNLNSEKIFIQDFQQYKITDCLYMFAAMIFFVLWLMNFTTPAAILEWTILFLAIILQYLASIRCTKNYNLLEKTREQQFDLSALILTIYMIGTVIMIFIIAPPTTKNNNNNSESLRTSYFFCLIILMHGAYTTNSYLTFKQCHTWDYLTNSMQ